MKPQIKPISTNIEKQNTYRVMKGRLSVAIREKFYFEAMLIEYALMEDRLRSFLLYMGVMENRTSRSVYKAVSNDILSIVNDYRSNDEDDSLKISSIGNKIKIIRSAAKWSAYAVHTDDTPYLAALNKNYQNIDIQALLDLLAELEGWKKYRNEVIHGLMNKNLDSLDENLKNKVLGGKSIAEQLVTQVKAFKKGNYSRRFLKLKDC